MTDDDENGWHNGLRVFHFLMMAVHAMVAGLLLTNMPDLRVHVQSAGDVRVGVLPGVFLALAAADHAMISFFWDVYARMLEHHTQRPVWFRWAEYSVSATVMNIQILLLCKCEFITFLILIALLTVVMNVCGGLAEPTERTDRTAMYNTVGWVCFSAIWLIIFGFFAAAGAGNVPVFVVVIVAVLFVLEASFGIVHLAAGTHVDSVNGAYAREYAYTTLSLASKLSLALITYYGTKARSTL